MNNLYSRNIKERNSLPKKELDISDFYKQLGDFSKSLPIERNAKINLNEPNYNKIKFNDIKESKISSTIDIINPFFNINFEQKNKIDLTQNHFKKALIRLNIENLFYSDNLANNFFLFLLIIIKMDLIIILNI